MKHASDSFVRDELSGSRPRRIAVAVVRADNREVLIDVLGDTVYISGGNATRRRREVVSPPAVVQIRVSSAFSEIGDGR